MKIKSRKALSSFTKEFCVASLLLFLSVVFALDGRYSKSVKEGLTLWACLILPSLFPYFFVTAVLSKLNLTRKISAKLSPLSEKLFRLSGISFFCFLTGLLAGYPTGSKLVGEFSENGFITGPERERASMACSAGSPMFLIGSVGNIAFGSLKFGLILYLTHFLSAVLCAFAFSFYKRKEPIARVSNKPIKIDAIFYESVYSSVISMLLVGGTVTLFYLLTEMLFNLGALNFLIIPLSRLTGDAITAKGIVFGIFEYSKGISVLSESAPQKIALPVCAAICGFGGLSIIMQSVSYLKKAKIKTAAFFISKVLSAAVNFIIGYLLSITFF